MDSRNFDGSPPDAFWVVSLTFDYEAAMNASFGSPAGQKTTVRIPAEIGPLYFGSFALKLEPSPGSDLTVPGTIVMKEDDKDFVLEITAGFNKGMFWIRVTPDLGPAKDVRVIVK